MFEKRWFSLLSKFILPFVIVTLFLIRVGYAQVTTPTTVLQGTIVLQSLQNLQDKNTKIQPGTPAKLSVKIENTGIEESPAGQLYIRYVFAKPLDRQPNSLIFQTEKIAIPALQPHTEKTITFETAHQLPSLIDFVREDWHSLSFTPKSFD
jgi:hypothetical protein